MGIQGSVREGILQFILDRYPGLMLLDMADGPIVEGTYDLMQEGVWIASYLVRFAIPPGYPNVLPAVFEIGGRIPKKASFHVNPDGSLCLGVPEALWIKVGGRFSVEMILDRLLRDHLIGATSALNGGCWPYGEYSHGGAGVCEFYRELSGSSDPKRLLSFVDLLEARSVKGHWPCYCGSAKQLRRCHLANVIEARAKKIPPIMLEKSKELIRAQMRR